MKSWHERMAKAEIRGAFTNTDKKRASDWGQCAVGEYSHAVEWYSSPIARPVDETLADVGSRFAAAVEADNIARARYLLDKIVERVAELGDPDKVEVKR